MTSLSIDAFIERFGEEPGYLDFATVGPVGRAVRDEEHAMSSLLGRSRFGTFATFEDQASRVHAAIAQLLGFSPSQIAFQPDAGCGITHTMFGLGGHVALSPSESPALTGAATRAADTLGRLTPLWLSTDHDRITPGSLRDQLTDDVTAVAVSIVDARTGYLVDLDGIRQVIGDRLLIVDASQGFGVVDVPWTVADVVVSGGETWVRAGWGTGFLAMSDRALDRIRPVLSSFSTDGVDGAPLDEVVLPIVGVEAFRLAQPDPVAQARFSAALEELSEVGVPAVRARLTDVTNRVIDLADEFGLTVSSSRDESERAGVVVITPPADQLTVLVASLHNHGVTAKTRNGAVRITPHVTSEDETFSMLRTSFVSFASAVVA